MKEGKKLIPSIIYILMGLQIVLGAGWILTGLGGVSQFEESTELIAMSRSLCIDEYTGILYPLCVKVLFGLGDFIKLPGCAFLYMLQVIAAGASYQYFLKKVVGLGKAKAWFFAGFILTLPPVAQCHAAVLPYSMASSVFIVLLAESVVLWKKEDFYSRKQLVFLGALWILSALICPDYAWFSGTAVVLSAVYYLFARKKLQWQLLVLCLTGILCIGTVEALTQKEGSMGKIQKSTGAVLVQRFVWPNFGAFQDFWGEEVKALWGARDLARLAMYPEQVIYEFGPLLEQTYGKEQAEEIYLEMAGTAFFLNTKHILLSMLQDMTAYVCPPLTMLCQLKGLGVSYTGWNYGRMKDYAPMLTGYYVNYSLYAWVVIMVLAVLYYVLCHVEKKEKGRRNWQGLHISGFLLVVSFFINIWYVLNSGNMQDYKKLIVNSVLCGFLVAKLMQDSDIDRKISKEYNSR